MSPRRPCRDGPGPGQGRPRRPPARPSWPTARTPRRGRPRASAWSPSYAPTGHERVAAGQRTPAGRGTKPVHMTEWTRYDAARMDPVRSPLHPGRELRAATPPRRPPPARLQPVLGLAPADAQPVEPDRPDGLDALSQPDPGHQRPDRVVAAPRRREVPRRVPRRPRDVRPVHGRRVRPLVRSAGTAASWTGRSPTSAPSTASTSRSASIPVASACWPATT